MIVVKKYFLYLLLIVLVVLSACSQEPKFQLYKGKSISIAVIGEPPKIKEEQVSFIEISFNELTSKDIDSYDAVFIMKEYLTQASENQYADVFLNSKIPIFYISAISHVPFTMKNEEYDKTWEWSPGNNYIVGISPKEDGSLKIWGSGLYNDKLSEEHEKDLYSTIFNIINKREL